MRQARTATVLVLALALTACTSLGTGRAQQLLGKYGLTLDATMATAKAVRAATEYPCSGHATPALTIPRATCQQIDTVQTGLQLAINKAGEKLEDARLGKQTDVIELALAFLDLANAESSLLAEANKDGVRWH